MQANASFRTEIAVNDCEPRTNDGHLYQRQAHRGPLTITIHKSIDAAHRDWQRLTMNKICSFHQTLAWCRKWVHAHSSKIAIVVGERDGQLLFLLPLEIVRRGPIRVARYIGAPFSNLNFGLFADNIDDSVGPKFGVHIVRALRKADLKADILHLDKVACTWRGVAHPFDGLNAIESANPAFQVTLHQDFTQVLAQVNAKRRRKKFRRAEAMLGEIGGYEHRIAASPEEADRFLQAFFRQKETRFKLHGIPNVFADQDIRTFFELLAQESLLQTDPGLELHAICLTGDNEGRIAAVAGLSKKQDHVICQFGSIDEDVVPEASPGELLFHLMIKRAAEQGNAVFDFGIGDQSYKRSWCDQQTVQYEFVNALSLLGMLAKPLITAEVHAKRVIKQNPNLFHFARQIRGRLINR